MAKKVDESRARSEGMKLAQSKLKILRTASVPITSEVVSAIMVEAMREARERLPEVNLELSPAQMAIVADVCEPCRRFYTAKAEAEAETDLAVEPE